MRALPEEGASGVTARVPAGESEKPRQTAEEDPKPAPQPPPAAEDIARPANPLVKKVGEWKVLEQDAGGFQSPFKNRAEAFKQPKFSLGCTKETETAVDRGVTWLVNHQEERGHWNCAKYAGKEADVAITGLALLALLGRGYSEKQGPYKDLVVRSVEWLKALQAENGCLRKEGETQSVGYQHGIAGLALVEAAALSRVPSTLEAAQRAVDYSIREHQNPRTGGWRYDPKSPNSDLSVSMWYIQQLKRAKEAGLKVDAAAIEGAVKFLDSVQGSMGGAGHLYGYTNNSSISHRRTAMGIYARQLLGWNRQDLQAGVNWFVGKGGVPAWGVNGGKADMYYWYYGTLAAFQQGGRAWKAWDAAMKNTLIENQRRGGDENGSWDPVGDYTEHMGRIGQTALATLCLEVYYRYDPIYGAPEPVRAATNDEKARADALILQLGSEEFRAREEASAELVKLGPPIRAYLEARLKELKDVGVPDVEVMSRLTRAIQMLEP